MADNIFTRFWNKQVEAAQIRAARKAFQFKGGILVTESTAMKVAAFNRGVQYLTSSVAKMPWNVKDKNFNILEGDIVHRLLNIAPNPEMNHMKFKLSLLFDSIVYGNGYAEIERNITGQPVALWYIDARRVEPVRDNKGKLWFRVDGGSSQSMVDIDPNDMFHIPNLHISQGIVGEGVVAWATRTLGISLGADRMAASLFNNGGLPSGILTHPKKISDEAYERMKKSWLEQHGEENNGGIAVLEEGVTFEALNMDPQVLQFLESRKFGVLEIARFLNVSPTKLYDNDKATFNNVEQANLEMTTDTLDAWATNIEAEANMKLMTRSYGGKFLELDLFQASRGDMKSRAEYYTKMMSTGAISPNEIRERESMPPYPEGNNKYIAVNNYTPAHLVEKVIEAQISKKSEPEKPTDKELKEEEESKELTQAILKLLNREKE